MHGITRRLAGALAPSAALALLLTACGDMPADTETTPADAESEATAEGPADDETSELEGEQEPITGDPAEGDNGTEPPDDDNGPDEQGPATDDEEGDVDEAATSGEPLATMEQGDLRAEITQFSRSGDVVELSFTVHNESSSTRPTYEAWNGGRELDEDDPLSIYIAGVSVVDSQSNTRAYPLRDGDGTCACSFMPEHFSRGSQGLYASFPAPPEDVDALTVQIPEFGSAEVPLS